MSGTVSPDNPPAIGRASEAPGPGRLVRFREQHQVDCKGSMACIPKGWIAVATAVEGSEAQVEALILGCRVQFTVPTEKLEPAQEVYPGSTPTPNDALGALKALYEACLQPQNLTMFEWAQGLAKATLLATPTGTINDPTVVQPLAPGEVVEYGGWEERWVYDEATRLIAFESRFVKRGQWRRLPARKGTVARAAAYLIQHAVDEQEEQV